MWHLDPSQGIPVVLPSDLVYNPMWPIFKLILDIIKTNSLTNCLVHWTINVARAPT